MTKYVEFPLESGGSILIESPDEPQKGTSGFARDDVAKEAIEKAQQSLDQSFENVRKSAELLVSKLRALSAPPDEMEVNFCLKASGELGHIAIGKAGAEANYTVTLRWRKEEKKEEGSGKKEEAEKGEQQEEAK
ncbi:MAG TPA: CU044_2847 family protein [Anaerolineales bacterium]|nr:CU044_2847 family protein [Anaerolineales bacterium]